MGSHWPSWTYDPPYSGYWDPVTSTLNWCEEDYYATPYAAEIVNTLTNLMFVFLAFKGIFNCVKHGHDSVFFVAFVGYLLVGTDPMQLVDELSMIYTTCLMCFATFSYSKSRQYAFALAMGLISLAIFITLYYHYLQDPLFHQYAYAILTVTVVARSLYVMEFTLRPSLRNSEEVFRLQHRKSMTAVQKEESRADDRRNTLILETMWLMIAVGLTTFLSGFGIWQLDNIFCSTLRSWRREVGLPWGIVLEGHGARNASILILYLLLAAGMFGGTLFHHIVWVTRCQDAIEMSHTASRFARIYASMDVTKTVDFQLSLNRTVTRILDEKLPVLISRTCVSLDVFKASAALRLAYMTWIIIYGLSIAVFYTQVSCSNDGHSGRETGYSLDEEVGGKCSAEEDYVQESISRGFEIGCRVATVVWILMLSSLPWSSAFEAFDYLTLLSLEGLLFSILPAMGILISSQRSDFSIMEWPGFDAYHTQPVVVPGRPLRGRHRHGSDRLHQTTYFTDANGMLIPQAGLGIGRSNSVSGARPAQIVINNTQRDEFSPPHSARRRSRDYSPGYSDDDSWDERARSPRGYRDHSHDRYRNRSRRRSRDRSRYHSRSRSRSHERRRDPHHQGHEPATPVPYLDPVTAAKLKKLEDIEKKEEEEAAQERAKKAMLIADAEKAAQKKRDEEYKKRVLAEADREKYEMEMKEKRKKEEEDKIFKARLKDMYLAQGYSEESIEEMIRDAEQKKKVHGHPPPPPPPPGPNSNNAVGIITDVAKVVDLNKPTYIKVHRKYLSPETLDAYELPWEWDDRDSSYLVIKCWINLKDQDRLFAHTRKLREQRLLTSSSPVALRKDSKGKLMLVREKSPAPQRSRSASRSWFLT
ncbi:MAG: hypothetical protein Q9211_000558 [Gyalolechia sp. 1 TL-2023]